jgi:hypothetical protein
MAEPAGINLLEFFHRHLRRVLPAQSAGPILGASPNISRNERIAPTLCAYGLIATLISCVLGYVICNYFWPNFFFHPVQAGKNVWLAAQGLSIVVYVVGVCYAFAGIRRASDQFR